jgi:hypothetical protein
MMETLAPRALYDNDELGMTSRLPLVSGVMFGSGMGLFTLVDGLAEGEPAGRTILYALVVGVASGAFYGWAFPRVLISMARRVMDRWYAGDPAVVPPPADGYLYRLPCSVLRASARLVEGVLYLGPRGLRFDPLLRARARMRESLVIEPLRDVHLELVETPVPRWLWVWGRRTLTRIQVRWPGGEARFGIPGAADVFATLQDRVDMIKQAPASGG